MDWAAYILGTVLLLLAIILNRRPRSNTIRARDISDVVIGGDVNSGVIVTGDNNRVVTQLHDQEPPAKQSPDRVSWAIGIVGVMITAAQLALDLWRK